MNFLRSLRLSILDFFSTERSEAYVFRYQLILALTSLLLLSYFLAVPFFGEERISYSAGFKANERAEFILGRKAGRTVTAPQDMRYEDKDKTKAKREKSLVGSPLIFTRNPEILASNIERINTTFKEFAKNKYKLSGKTNKESTPVVKAIRSDEKLKVLHSLSLDGLRYIQNPKVIPKLRTALIKGMQLLHKDWLIVKKNSALLENNIFGNILVVGPDESKPLKFPADRVLTTEEIFQTKPGQRLNDHLKAKLNLGKKDQTFLRTMLWDLVLDNPPAAFSSEKTELEKERRLEEVEPVMVELKAGSVLILQGAIVTQVHIWQFEAYNKLLSSTNFASISSILVLQAVFFFVLLLILRHFGYRKLNSLSDNTIVFSLLWLLALISYGVEFWYYGNYRYSIAGVMTAPKDLFPLGLVLPIPVISTILATIFGRTISFVMGLYLSFFAFVASQYDPHTFMLVFPTSIMVAFSAYKISKRIHFFRISFYTFILQTFSLTALALQQEAIYPQLFINIGVNFVVCAIWALVSSSLLTIYEFIFNVPTTFRLLELADRDNPLLQRISELAPSTYQHTMLVAGLSEKAVRSIGGNPLLTRVGAYYHDIGKTINAGFYIENQHLIPKPEYAATMSPREAAKKIIDHVLDGIVMGRQANLPKEIIDFIPQHHGTSTMAYFYHQAMRDKKERGEISRDDFRYPGPKPQSKEAAVMMLADSLEAAARSLNDPTPDELNDLILRIFKIKMDENQLDESGLTVGDLELVRVSFLEELVAMAHSRPKYPSQKSIAKLETKGAREAGNSAGAKTSAKSKNKPAEKTKAKTKAGKPKNGKPVAKKTNAATKVKKTSGTKGK